MNWSWDRLYMDYGHASRDLEMNITADGWYYKGIDSYLVVTVGPRVKVWCWLTLNGQQELVKLINLPHRCCMTEQQIMNKQQQLTKDMIADQDTWPLWPLLALARVKGKGMPELGVLHANNGIITTVYLCNLYSFNPACKSIDYLSPDELIKEGWLVN